MALNLYCLPNTGPEWEATDGTFTVTLKAKSEELTTKLKVHLIRDDTLPWEQCDVGAEPVFGDQPSSAAHRGGAFSTIEAQLKANPGFSGGWSVNLGLARPTKHAKGWGLSYYRTHVPDGAKVAAGLGETVALEPATVARPARIEFKGDLAVCDGRQVEILLGIEHAGLTLTEATLKTVLRAGD